MTDTTNLRGSRRVSIAIKVGLPLAAAALLAAACSGGGGSSSSSSSASSPAARGGSGAAASPAGGGSKATVQVRMSNGTSFLTGSSGRSLYLWLADSKNKSVCTGACASAWPPLTVTGTPTAGAGVKASNLGTITRSGGAKQVTYAGHPLYFFSGDSAAGQTNGEGSTAFGAPWYLVAPSGQQITKLTAAAGAPASKSGSGGFSY